MKLGDVLRKERTLRGISPDEAAARLGLAASEYDLLESGHSPAESWGPLLARLAVKLGVQTSRLVSETGRSDGALAGSCGVRIRRHREAGRRSAAEVAAAAGLSPEVYEQIERGESPVEEYGPLLLRVSEMFEQPVFNLFYPCALPLEKIEDYP
jgi:transcriptional regulator with XRE-family HTH domain